MDRNQVSQDSLTVTELKGGFSGKQGPVLDDGTYEAEYQKMSVFMDNTQWGEKKAARLYFKITRGKYRDQVTSYKGTMFQDRETQEWIVGSKSKLADAIHAVSGGKTLSPEHVGAKVFVVVKKGVSKKTGNPYSFVDNVIPRPSDDDEPLSQSVAAEAHRPAPAAARPAPAQRAPVQAATQATVARAAAKPAIPAPVEDGGGLLADLTELSDFKD